MRSAGLLVLLIATSAGAAEPKAELLSVRRIGDRAPHNAFTDLLRANDRWYCVYREGKAHVSPDGAIRVLTSTDKDILMLARFDNGKATFVFAFSTADGKTLFNGPIVKDEDRKAMRKFLKDDSAVVRTRVALALVERKDGDTAGTMGPLAIWASTRRRTSNSA